MNQNHLFIAIFRDAIYTKMCLCFEDKTSIAKKNNRRSIIKQVSSADIKRNGADS